MNPYFSQILGKDVQSVLMKLAKSLCSQYVNVLKKRDSRISHKILDEDGQDVATDLLTMGREHCPRDKARPIEGEDGVTDCSDSPRVCEKYG